MAAACSSQEFATLCGHTVSFTPLSFVTHDDGRKEATAVAIAAQSKEWTLEWTHSMRSSAANPGGAGLGLVVYEQLSVYAAAAAHPPPRAVRCRV